MKDYNDIINQTFGYRKVLSFAGKNHRGTPFYECRCVCGKIDKVSRGSLLNGNGQKCKSCAIKEAKHKIWLETNDPDLETGCADDKKYKGLNTDSALSSDEILIKYLMEKK